MKYGWPRSGRISRLALPVAVCFAITSLAIALPSMALPTFFGGQLYYTGGDVTVDVLHNDTVYDEVLQLRSALGILDVADGSLVGSRVTLTMQQLANMGIGVGDELQFGIHVRNTGYDFMVGPGERNADGLDHAYVRTGRNNIYVGFEDLLHGGDRDYNDTIYRFSGGMTADPDFAPRAATTTEPTESSTAPQPSMLLLLLPAAGLLAFGFRKR